MWKLFKRNKVNTPVKEIPDNGLLQIQATNQKLRAELRKIEEKLDELKTDTETATKRLTAHRKTVDLQTKQILTQMGWNEL